MVRRSSEELFKNRSGAAGSPSDPQLPHLALRPNLFLNSLSLQWRGERWPLIDLRRGCARRMPNPPLARHQAKDRRQDKGLLNMGGFGGRLAGPEKSVLCLLAWVESSTSSRPHLPVIILSTGGVFAASGAIGDGHGRCRTRQERGNGLPRVAALL